MDGQICSDGETLRISPLSTRKARRRMRYPRISTQIPAATLEGRVRVKATQMYEYLQDEIKQIKAGQSPAIVPAGIILHDFQKVRHAVARIHMQPYDVFFNSHGPPVYFFGAPQDDGDTEVTTKLLFDLFEENGISRKIFFNDSTELYFDEDKDKIIMSSPHRMPLYSGTYAETSDFPTRFARINMLGLRRKYRSIVGPDEVSAFASLNQDLQDEMLQKIEEFSREWVGIEKNLVRYLAQGPEERCFEYLQGLVKHMACKETVSYEIEKVVMEALHDILDENFDAPARLVGRVHDLVKPLTGPSIPLENFDAYRKAMTCLPAKIRELRDRRFAYVMQLHEAISPDMERFKAKIPETEWIKHSSTLPNLAGLLREAKINYAIFVPKPDSVYKFPDSVLSTLSTV